MIIRHLASVLTLAALAGIAPAAIADSSADREVPCILRDNHVASVRPYRTEEHIGRATLQRLRGAEIRVQAEPGLTAEWLRLKLGRHLAAMQGMAAMKDCVFDVDRVKLQVDSAGAGFVVKLIAKEAGDAAEVLRRAQLLLGRQGA